MPQQRSSSGSPGLCPPPTWRQIQLGLEPGSSRRDRNTDPGGAGALKGGRVGRGTGYWGTGGCPREHLGPRKWGRSGARCSGRLRLSGRRENAGSGGGEDLERSRCDESKTAERELRRKGTFSRDLGSGAFPFEVPPPITYKRTSRPGSRTWEGTGRWKDGSEAELAR